MATTVIWDGLNNPEADLVGRVSMGVWVDVVSRYDGTWTGYYANREIANCPTRNEAQAAVEQYIRDSWEFPA